LIDDSHWHCDCFILILTRDCHCSRSVTRTVQSTATVTVYCTVVDRYYNYYSNAIYKIIVWDIAFSVTVTLDYGN